MFDVPFQQLQNPLGTGLGICFDLLFEVICQYCGPCDINDLRPWATKELNLITQNLCQKMFQNDTAVCLKKPARAGPCASRGESAAGSQLARGSTEDVSLSHSAGPESLEHRL